MPSSCQGRLDHERLVERQSLPRPGSVAGRGGLVQISEGLVRGHEFQPHPGVLGQRVRYRIQLGQQQLHRPIDRWAGRRTGGGIHGNEAVGEVGDSLIDLFVLNEVRK